MSDSKPFEIRAHLLTLAREVLSENMHVQMQAHRDALGANPGVPIPAYNGPTSVSVEQIIAEAEKLYAFVSKK